MSAISPLSLLSTRSKAVAILGIPFIDTVKRVGSMHILVKPMKGRSDSVELPALKLLRKSYELEV